MRLTDRQEDESFVTFNDRTIEIDLVYDNVLKAIELSQDRTFSGNEKIFIWAELFVIDYDTLEGFTEEDLVNFVELIFDKISGGKTKTKKKDKKLFCFVQDADYIYSSFKAVYGIDLFDLQGSLPWNSFLSLLRGLPDNCKFKEIISIRAAEIPKQNKGNKDEIKRLRELKSMYALDNDGQEKIDKNKMLSNKLNAISEMYASKR